MSLFQAVQQWKSIDFDTELHIAQYHNLKLLRIICHICNLIKSDNMFDSIHSIR